VRKSKLPLKKLHTLVSYFLKRVGPNKQVKKKGRPQKYEDALIITLWLFQTFIADKGYDAVDIIESLSLRKLSNENWKRYGRMRYRVEQL